MYARVARFEGGEAEAIRQSAADMAERAPSGPPEGVPAVGFTMLVDPDGGRSIGVVLFETEDALREGDAALERMDPAPGAGHRMSLDTYEVAVDVRMETARQ
jgi:hypothetical protein